MRLGRNRVTTAEVWEFARWRDDPVNDAAYTALEACYLDARRYVVQPGTKGFRVVDIWTGQPAVIALTPQEGISEAEARQIAALLNRRSAKGDRSIRQ